MAIRPRLVVAARREKAGDQGKSRAPAAEFGWRDIAWLLPGFFGGLRLVSAAGGVEGGGLSGAPAVVAGVLLATGRPKIGLTR